MRQIYPEPAVLTDRQLAARYRGPDTAGQTSHWLRANMVASLDGAATVRGRTGGLSGEADRQVFAMLRALADVIVVGAGTARIEGYGPVRPGQEGARWAWLRAGRALAPIAVITRRIDLDPAGPLLAAPPGLARPIVITTEAAPPDRRAAVAGRAELIVAGRESVDIRAAVDALAGRGYRHILTEGGPYLLSQIIEAGLLDELCLTLSPLLAGPGASRIVADIGPLRQPGGAAARPLELAHVLADDGHLICRYVRPADG
ncbi:MAG TPA: pyrimidine reductase family protein [Streptosporangiaceae bacterium]|nr:pyrimidine reductase family protein [Streptosporangiaceae bacterium]